MKFLKPNYWQWENHCGLNVNCPHDHVLERLSLQLLVFLWEAVEALRREAQCLRWQGWAFGATARPPLLPGKQTLVLPLTEPSCLRTKLPEMDSRWFSSPWSCFSLSYFVKMTRKVTNKIMRNYVQSPEHTEYDYLTVVILITSPWNTITVFLAQRRPSLSYTQPSLPQHLSPSSLSNHTVCSCSLISYKVVPWILYPAGGCSLMRGWCIYIPLHHPSKNPLCRNI